VKKLIRLLNAGFTRIKKNKLFLLLSIFSIGLALFMVLNGYNSMKKYSEIITVDGLILKYSVIIGIIIAIFASLFLGVGYSDGAIRNKIIIGHKRTDIYLSNLLIIVITSILSYILFMIITSVTGIPLFGKISISTSSFLMSLFCVFMAIIAYSSIFTFIAMLISNKMISAIISIMLAFSMMIMGLTCLSILSESEYIKTAEVKNMETSEFQFVEIPNPHYPSKTKRKVCETLLDINPAGQMLEIVGETARDLKILPIYSFGIIVIFTSLGIMLFKKKELK